MADFSSLLFLSSALIYARRIATNYVGKSPGRGRAEAGWMDGASKMHESSTHFLSCVVEFNNVVEKSREDDAFSTRKCTRHDGCLLKMNSPIIPRSLLTSLLFTVDRSDQPQLDVSDPS